MAKTKDSGDLVGRSATSLVLIGTKNPVYWFRFKSFINVKGRQCLINPIGDEGGWSVPCHSSQNGWLNT